MKKNPKIEKVIIDRQLCIGAASCVVLYGEAFELDNEGKAVFKLPEDAQWDDQRLKEAAESCPTKAIILIDENGKQVYP